MSHGSDVSSVDVSRDGVPGRASADAFDDLYEAITAADAMLEPTAAKAMREARRVLLGEVGADDATQGRLLLPMSMKSWISPWEGEQATLISAKVRAALARAERMTWVMDHPLYPIDTLRAVLAWADDVRARADSLEHNERAVLERGLQRLSQRLGR